MSDVAVEDWWEAFQVERVLEDDFGQLVPPEMKRIRLSHPAFADHDIAVLLSDKVPADLRPHVARHLASGLGRAIADIIVDRIAEKISVAEDESIGHVYARAARKELGKK